jgi:hypothetical protein
MIGPSDFILASRQQGGQQMQRAHHPNRPDGQGYQKHVACKASFLSLARDFLMGSQAPGLREDF